MHYHYAVIERPLGAPEDSPDDNPSMETVDYKRQPSPTNIRAAIAADGGTCCGVIRGGMFGLATNQVASLCVWSETAQAHHCVESLCKTQNIHIAEQLTLQATVRPAPEEVMTRPGIYVIRWIRMNAEDVGEYTSLCLQTWPAFEQANKTRCYGVFTVDGDTHPGTILMLTWYADLSAWEQSRQLAAKDVHLWVRRSQMELSHWAQAGRLDID